MGSYGLYMVLSGFISAIMGGGAVQLFNIRANKKRANSEATSAEAVAESQMLKNVRDSLSAYKDITEDLRKEIELYRQKAEEQGKQLESMRKEIAKLTSKVVKLSNTISRIPKMLNSITHENLEIMVQKIKDEINKEQNIQQD